MVMSRIHFCYFIIFIHFIFIAACTESSSSKQNVAVSSLSAGVSLLNVAGSWTEPTEVTRYAASDPGSGIKRFKLHMTSQGDAFIALQTMQRGLIDRFDASIAYRAVGSTGWQQDRLFTDVPMSFNSFPEIYTNKLSNNAFATFVSNDSQTNSNKSYLSRFDSNEGWSTPVSLGDIGWQPNVITGASGNTSMIWVTHADNGTVELHARFFDVTDGLSLMSTLVRGKPNVPGRFFIRDPVAYMDAQGTTQVYWYENEILSNNAADGSVQSNLWQSEYNVVSGWAIPSKIEEGAFSGESPVAQMQVMQDEATGNILLLLRSHNFNGEELNTLHYREGGWTKTTAIGPSNSETMMGSNVSINDKGEAVLVWADIDPFLVMKITIWSQRFNFVDGWAAAEMIAEKTPSPPPQGFGYGSGDGPLVDINTNGHIVVLWKDIFSNTEDYYASLYIPESGWGESQLVVTTQEQMSSMASPTFEARPMVTINDNNQASVAWMDIVRNSQNIMYQVMMRDHIPGATAATLVAKNVANIKPISTVAQFDDQSQNKPLVTRRMAVNVTDNQRPLSLAGQRLLSAWDTPTEIDNVVLPMDASSYFIGPRLWANNQEAAFVYWNGGSQVLDEAGNAIVNSAIFHRESKAGAWLSSMPLSEEELSTSVLIGIYLQQNTGIAYAMWHGACDGLCDELYVSRFEPTLGWEAPTLIANATCCGQLFLDAEGNVTALWRGNEPGVAPNSPNASAQTQWVARRYVHGTGWLPPELSINNDAAANRIQSHEMKNNLMVAGGFDDGRVFLLWDESMKNRNSIRFTAQFDPATGWSDLGELPAVGFGPFMDLGDPTLHINQQNNKVQIFTDSLVFPPSGGIGKNQLTVTQFDGRNWLGTQSISNVADTSGFIGYPSYVSDSNAAGEVVFVAQESLTIDGIYPTVVLHPYYFSPAQGWTADTGTFITDPIPLTDSSVVGMPFVDALEKLRLSVNESGDAAIAWIDNSSLERALYVSHYQPASGWGIKELVTTIDGNSQYFGELDLHLDDNGQVSLVWDQALVTLNTVEHHIYTTVHHDKGTVVAPPVEDTPKPPAGQGGVAKSDNWSESMVAYQSSAGAAGFMSKDLMAPPRLSAIAADSILLSSHLGIDYDPMKQQYASHEVSVKTLTLGGEGNWQDITPVQTDKPITSGIQTANDPANNITYGAWLSDNELFIDRQSANQWGVPVSVASNVSEFFLLTNASGVVYLLWQDTLDVQTLNLDIVNSSAEGNVQLNTPSSITVAQGRLTDGPVMDLQGNVWVSWYMDDASATQQGFLLSQYTRDVGWADPMARLALEGMEPSLGLIAAAGTDEVVFISQEISSRQLMATAFSSSAGWGSWQALASQESATSALMGLPRLVSNNQGDVMILWVEEQKSNNGGIAHKVYTRQYLNTPAAAGSWQPAMFVADIAHPNINETPDLFLADNANALVVWTQMIEWKGAVFANKFLPETGWLETPEIVAYAVDRFSLTNYVTPKGMIFSNGEIVVVWKYTSYEENQVLSAVSQM